MNQGIESEKCLRIKKLYKILYKHIILDLLAMSGMFDKTHYCLRKHVSIHDYTILNLFFMLTLLCPTSVRI